MVGRDPNGDTETRLGIVSGDGATLAASGGIGLSPESSRRIVRITLGKSPRVDEMAASEVRGLL